MQSEHHGRFFKKKMEKITFIVMRPKNCTRSHCANQVTFQTSYCCPLKQATAGQQEKGHSRMRARFIGL